MIIKLLTMTQNAEELIETACRTCYDSTPNEETRAKFISSVIKRGHESVIEHATASFKITGISRALSHQLVRHRIASYSQRSQRYVKEGQFEFVTPDSIKANDKMLERYDTLMYAIQLTYDLLLQEGIKAEDARFILPNACHTEIVVTMNLRVLRHFFKTRCDKHAQWEIRKMAQDMLTIMINEIPCCFNDLEYLLETV